MCARFWLRACGGAFRGSSHPGEPSRRLAPRSPGPRTSPPHLPFQSRVRSHLWAQSWCWARGVPASCGLFLSSSAKSVNFCPLYSGPMVCRRGELGSACKPRATSTLLEGTYLRYCVANHERAPRDSCLGHKRLERVSELAHHLARDTLPRGHEFVLSVRMCCVNTSLVLPRPRAKEG